MASSKHDPRAKKYQVVLNDHLVEEIIDRMGYKGDDRRRYTIAMFSIRWGVNAATNGRVKSRVLRNAEKVGHYITLASLVRILGNSAAIRDLRWLSKDSKLPTTPFGPKTEAAARELCDAACQQVDRGLFRP